VSSVLKADIGINRREQKSMIKNWKSKEEEYTAQRQRKNARAESLILWLIKKTVAVFPLYKSSHFQSSPHVCTYIFMNSLYYHETKTRKICQEILDPILAKLNNVIRMYV
jgi:hypothetical protein